jgi:uncharacterized protein involved in type VI secretion and phage assembly
MSHAGVYRAVVVGMTDPQAEGRLQVQIPSLGGRTLWAECCVPARRGGGGSRGGIGTTVWVAFENGDASRPVVLGMKP